MGGEIPPGLGELQGRIQAWRLERRKSEAMPAVLWSDTIEQAKRLGINVTARALGLNPTRLRVRMHGESEVSSGGFLELRGTVPGRSSQAMTPSGALIGTTIELCSDHGSRLTIQLGAGHALDLTALVRAFRD